MRLLLLFALCQDYSLQAPPVPPTQKLAVPAPCDEETQICKGDTFNWTKLYEDVMVRI